MQPDGKILLGGNFTSISGRPRAHLARLNLDGSVDADFSPSADSTVYSMALQRDGKIVIGGFFNSVGGAGYSHLARLMTDGSIDAGFGASVNGEVLSVAVQADGKILFGGNFSNVDGTTRNHVARVNADGTIDNDFNPNANGDIYSIALQADGKILLGGTFTALNPNQPIYPPQPNFVRLSPNGNLDQTLKVYANSPVYSVAVQADGKILIGGAFSSVNATCPDHNSGPCGNAGARIARLNADRSTQALKVNFTTVQWLRDGAAPEVEQVTFDLKTDAAGPGCRWARRFVSPEDGNLSCSHSPRRVRCEHVVAPRAASATAARL